MGFTSPSLRLHVESMFLIRGYVSLGCFVNLFLPFEARGLDHIEPLSDSCLWFDGTVIFVEGFGNVGKTEIFLPNCVDMLFSYQLYCKPMFVIPLYHLHMRTCPPSLQSGVEWNKIWNKNWFLLRYIVSLHKYASSPLSHWHVLQRNF